MKLKRIAMILAAAQISVAAAQDADEAVYARNIFKDVAAEIEAGLRASPIPANKTIALLPVKGPFGDQWIAGLLQNAVTDAGRTCILANRDPEFAAILKEIEWDVRKVDVLDPATIDRFGKLKSAQILLSAEVISSKGIVDVKTKNIRSAFLEVELHALEIATAKHLWGGVFAKRHYLPSSGLQEVSIDSIPVELRKIMHGKLCGDIVESLRGAAKLGGVKTVAILPLAGDVREYAGSLVRDAVSQTSITPKNLDVTTLSEARHSFRDGMPADAVMYGALRDLSVTIDKEQPLSESKTYNVEIQLCIEQAKTHEQLWSKTLLVSESEARSGWWYAATRYFPSLREKPWLVIAIPLGVILILVALAIFLHYCTRVK